jgi:glutamate racemase
LAPVVGVITPEAYAAVRTTRNRRIGLLATQATVSAGRYEALVRTLDAGVRFTVACPDLAPLIVEGAQTVDAVRIRGAAQAAGCDTVILAARTIRGEGCSSVSSGAT